MRKRSTTRTTNQRSRRGASTPGARRQTTLRAQAVRTGGRRAKPGRRSRPATRSASSTAHITTDYDTIREWVESRGGWPATVSRTAKGQRAGILRIDFPGFSGSGTLKPISWDDWFEKFEESDLAFLFQEKTADGKTSRFFKLIERE